MKMSAWRAQTIESSPGCLQAKPSWRQNSTRLKKQHRLSTEGGWPDFNGISMSTRLTGAVCCREFRSIVTRLLDRDECNWRANEPYAAAR
ncbi:unnamed protein product [Calypogeia fissa]